MISEAEKSEDFGVSWWCSIAHSDLSMSHTLAILSGILLPTLALGDVVINEIAATHAPRNLRWDENDQAFAGAGPAWWSSGFPALDWETGNMPIGYSLGSIATNLGGDLRNVAPSFYVRKNFTVTTGEAAVSDPVVLSINYNDGFIAWLNGVEIARRNMGADKAHLFHDQLSYRVSGLNTSNETISLASAASLLVEGENVLAVQVNNHTLSGNMRLDMSLRINRPSGGDPQLFTSGSEVNYLPGLREMTSGLVEPATPAEDPSDWIELYNDGAAAVDLTGWTLSDDVSNPAQWTFPAGTSIASGDYLLVLADDPSSPIANAAYLHANFKLSGSGEFLGLFNESGLAVSSFAPKFPRQYPNFSFGRDSSGMMAFYATPTPGDANEGQVFQDKVDAPDFDRKGGFYDDAIAVTLTSQTPGATIRFTIDGTEPTLTNGNDYTLPLSLARITTQKGHVIRARAFLDGFISSNTKTHTFLIGQDARLRNSPSLVYAGDPERALYDPFGVMGINGGRYNDNLWESTGPADYNNVINRGRAYERPIHAEFYFADGTVGFRSDVGLRVAASTYSRPRMQLNQTARSPWLSQGLQKPSFNLYFRDDYGNPSVDLPLNGPARTFSGYERFRVRAGKNDIINPYITDEFFRRLSHDMGNGASLGVINSLYVNGEFKGYYNMVERLREPFFRSLHGSEDNAQWDVLQFEGNDNIAEGDKGAWNDMLSRLNASMNPTNWEKVLEVADVENMANYYLLNIYGATWDWPHNNWVAARERSDSGRYRLYVWDAEGAMNTKGDRPISQEMIRTYILGTVSGQTGKTGTRGELRDLWRALNRWEEFHLVFADQIQKHLFNGGILDDRDQFNSHMRKRFDGLAGEFEDLLLLVQNQTLQRTKFTQWVRSATGRRRYLFGPVREDFRDHDLWPELGPPEFSQFGGVVEEGSSILVNNEAGLVYYTTDGSDPRQVGGSPNPSAISQPGSLVDELLVSNGDEWAYNDSDGDLGAAWRLLAYDDGEWSRGNGPLGYGGIKNGTDSVSLATQVNGTSRQPTSYFRKTFEIGDASAFLALNLSLLSDGGVAISLNGVEAFRGSNLAAGFDYNTLPSPDTDDGNEGDYTTFSLDPAFLINGMNVIAIELHNSPGNSDMALDLELAGQRVDGANLPVIVDGPLILKARSFKNGEWSAVTSAEFTVDTVPATDENLAISEMLYNPLGASQAEQDAGFNDGDLFEFIRLENFSAATLDLGPVRFTDGITFDFSESTLRVLGPGGKVILVKNPEAFRFRYGGGFDHLIAGQFGGQLSNGGEQLRLIGADDAIIHEFEFETGSPWPDLSALDGHSIQVIHSAADHGEGSNWRASASPGGLPEGSLDFAGWQSGIFTAAELADLTISGPDEDPDGDGWSNFFEFALGSLPLVNSSSPGVLQSALQEIDGEHFLTLSFTRSAGERAVVFTAEISNDLDLWSGGGLPILPDIVNPDGSITSTFRHPVPIEGGEHYLRLKVTSQ